MDILLNTGSQPTKITSECGTALLAIDTNEVVRVLLGINIVEIRRQDGGWTIHHSTNIKSVVSPPGGSNIDERCETQEQLDRQHHELLLRK